MITILHCTVGCTAQSVDFCTVLRTVRHCTLVFTGIFELVTGLAWDQSVLRLCRRGTALHSSSPGTRVTSEKMRAVLHCAVLADEDSGCYLELEASPPEVIVLGAFLRDLACT